MVLRGRGLDPRDIFLLLAILIALDAAILAVMLTLFYTH